MTHKQINYIKKNLCIQNQSSFINRGVTVKQCAGNCHLFDILSMFTSVITEAANHGDNVGVYNKEGQSM